MRDAWDTTQLGSVTTLRRGLSYTASQLQPPGIPFVTIKCFNKGGGFRTDGFKTFRGHVPDDYVLRGGELLIANTDLTRDASIVGAAAVVPRLPHHAAFSMDVSRLVEDRARADAAYLGYRLTARDARAFMQARSAGSTVLHLHTREVPKFTFDLPALIEQRRIAEVLDTLNALIRNTEQLIAKLKQVKQGLLHDLLTRGIDENGELRDPDRHPEQFKDLPLGRIPKTWDVAPFKERQTSSRPYLKTGPFGSSLKQEHWVHEGVPVITIGSLGEGFFQKSELLHVADKTAAALAAYAVQSGDIVFSRVADVGRSVVVREPQCGWIMSSNLMWISLDQRRVVPDAVQAQIASNPLVKGQISRLVNSAGRDIANAAVMNAMLLPWPPFEEQQEIAQRLHCAGVVLVDEEQAYEKLCLLKAGLMEDLLTGRIRTTDLDESLFPGEGI